MEFWIESTTHEYLENVHRREEISVVRVNASRICVGVKWRKVPWEFWEGNVLGTEQKTFRYFRFFLSFQNER